MFFCDFVYKNFDFSEVVVWAHTYIQTSSVTPKLIQKIDKLSTHKFCILLSFFSDFLSVLLLLLLLFGCCNNVS